MGKNRLVVFAAASAAFALSLIMVYSNVWNTFPKDVVLTKMSNGFDYTDEMPWSSGTSSDNSAGSLHSRLVKMGGHDTASGIEDLCNKLMAGGAESGTGWNPGHSAADYIMCGQTVRPSSRAGSRSDDDR
uniref:Uncharacterized protein n=1 Tax=Cryptomonas curvata TaxID=233186 RepID=A0A7S0QQR3_9CRYP|mmetsp:Transcript_50757/g.106065  ORF Transcript_50757/g.106065 Transcript_50757/m.106065 type:complete len:130 (+) Transcript_50757:3-392(+)